MTKRIGSFETKYDGYRTIAVINRDEVNLFSRNHLSFFNKNFKAIADELKEIDQHVAVLDGEVVVEDDAGRSDFQLLQNYIKTRKRTVEILRFRYFKFGW